MWFGKKKHSTSTIDVVCGCFPHSLRDDVLVILELLQAAPYELKSSSGGCCNVGDESVFLTSRVSFPKVKEADLKSLTEQQRAVLAALMTRHHDGYQRQYWVRVLCAHPRSWTAPYLADSLGDYVVEIQQVICDSVSSEWKMVMADYRLHNPDRIQPLNARILSYWNTYHRWYPPNILNLREHPGYVAAVELGLWDKSIAKRLLQRQG